MISEVREQLAALTDPDVGQGAVFRAVAAGMRAAGYEVLTVDDVDEMADQLEGIEEVA